MPYPTSTIANGTGSSVRRANTPYDMGALDARSLLVMHGRFGAALPMVASSRYPGRVGSNARVAIAGRYAQNGGRRLGQVQEVATAASALVPAIDSIESLFGGGATGDDAERQAAIYTMYEQAMTSPGSVASIKAVVGLYTIANQIYDPVNGVQRNNPQATRTYAQQAIETLSEQGWTLINANFAPVYTGVGASGAIYSANQTTGQQQVVATAKLPASSSSALGILLILGVGAYVVMNHKKG